MVVDRVVKMEQELSLLKGTRSELKQELGDQRRRLKAKSEAVRADAAQRIAGIESALAACDAQLATKELEVTFEEASRSLQQAHRAFLEGQQRALEAGAGQPLSERVIASRLEELESIRSTARLLENRAKELASIIRMFVQTNPRGWMRSDDPLKRYLAWCSAVSDLFTFLKDNPRYGITPDQLVALLGIVRATPFLTVSYAAFEKQVCAGLVVDVHGEAVTAERVAEIRNRTVQTPSVEIRRRGEEQPIEELLDLMDPQYAEGDGDDISVLKLDVLIEKALRAAGIHRVGQLRRSGDELTSISGIGEHRVTAIHDALVRRRAA